MFIGLESIMISCIFWASKFVDELCMVAKGVKIKEF